MKRFMKEFNEDIDIIYDELDDLSDHEKVNITKSEGIVCANAMNSYIAMLLPLAKKYQTRYHEVRTRDRLAGFTSDGPHRHDLVLRVGGRPVRDVLSSGQAKVVAAALRLAAHAEVERRRGEFIPLVVDDVDAELDRTTLDKLVCHTGTERQLFLSSAHREMVQPAITAARVVTLRGGQVLTE